MSQMDKLIYLPLLTWYWILFIILYYTIFTFFLGTFSSGYKTRSFFFYQILFLVRYNSVYGDKIQFILSQWKLLNNFFIFSLLLFFNKIHISQYYYSCSRH